MLKKTFDLLVRLISQPAKAWSMLADKQENNNEDFFRSYLYPLFGIVALLSFVGVLLTTPEVRHENQSFNGYLQFALKNCIRLIIITFSGFHLASYILSEVMKKIFNRPEELKLCQRFVGYSSSLIYLLILTRSLFPSLFFLYIFLFYAVYIVWEGAIPYMKMEENDQLKFTLWTGAIVLLTPFLIEIAMVSLMPRLI
ncbi:MAG: hypothetical protein LBJ72_14065 [Dysgonamonadaceae bacterium]|jgi:hypothetical protein|nr:hypothetical protein [Dysgonamonadaceae bacterium]